MDLVEATHDDVDRLAEFWYALASEMESYDELNELSVEGPDEVEAGFADLLDEGDTDVYLLRAEGTDIGYLLLREGDHPTRAHSTYVDLVDLFVAPDYRNEGHGSDAMDAVEGTARERDADYVEVSCEWRNDGARRFYADNGFEPKQVTYARRVG